MSDVKEPNVDYAAEEIILDDGTGVEPEDTGSDETITEPFNPALIRVETKPMTIDLLLKRIRRGELDLAPDFQRKAGIWKPDARSRLIESILIRIPLPAFYMDATNDDKWLVVDGLQRLTALKQFVLDKTLRLTKLDFLKQLEGKSYDELHRSYQRRIDETQVTIYLIEKGTPDGVKFNIFKRINTGGLPLSAQEIRHALNQGKASKLLVQLAESNEFKQAINYSIRDDRMADRECVLRFLAFLRFPYTNYKYDKEIDSFDSFLNKAMADINKMSDEELEVLQSRFLRTMIAAFDIFGKNAFRKGYRSPINKALFESWSVNLDQLSDQQLRLLRERKNTLSENFINLRYQTAFNDAISQSTGDIKKVKLRFSALEDLITQVLS